MALVRNGANLYGNNCRWHSATGVTALASAFDGSCKRNWHLGSHRITDVTDKSGFPNGYRAPVAWRLPQKAGAITSRNEAYLTVNGAATGALGKNSPATATLTIEGFAVGGLIAGGVAAATLTISGSASAFAAIGSTALATITVDGSAAIGAIGHMGADGVLTVTGTLTSYARGHMVATTDFGNDLSPTSLANAVWNATAASLNAAGSMGEKLNDAGSAANPWTEVIESGYTAAQIMRLIAAYVAGDATGLDTAPVFKSMDGGKTRLAGTLSGGARTVTTRDPT